MKNLLIAVLSLLSVTSFSSAMAEEINNYELALGTTEGDLSLALTVKDVWPVDVRIEFVELRKTSMDFLADIESAAILESTGVTPYFGFGVETRNPSFRAILGGKMQLKKAKNSAIFAEFMASKGDKSDKSFTIGMIKSF